MITAVHLGLGAFHRAHQAAYTAADPEAGIAAYTFRSTALPEALTAQGGRYHLLIRSDDGPELREIASIVRARPGTDLESWRRDLSSGSVSVLTLTITEAGYADPATIGRVLDGLAARRTGSGAPIALVPCDNLPGNGSVLRDALLRVAEPGLGAWIDEHVGFVDTVVDRITPATTADDLTEVARLLPRGVRDDVPVVTEPFSEWVLAGEFPHGRPAWPARFVDDAAPYARRKLWFLNGAHSLLAYVGPSRGAATVDEAVRDPEVARLMESWWDAAARHARVDCLDDYRGALRTRFAQRGIRHRLAQIARDGSAKIPARILPVLALERAAGRLPDGAVGALAGWVAHLRAGEVHDPRAADLVPAARSGGARAVLGALGSPDAIALAGDDELVRTVDASAP
ncbi:mannitol dehydrogenase family protein [Actinomycetospora endophytica]|uniref:Mannitol-1-phosphate 5-dehydrogenase n=1 Tax=Actinomycetospora endophytica TaxID=2291215 RepID=A0ABS8PBE3_9PSEU|nr:mannitol dehydrogenase family protein [Actinomycetospora endophytica]MCD2195599.1 mannitol dehydrogenase family protein [Actinomycetospora endophytica]